MIVDNLLTPYREDFPYPYVPPPKSISLWEPMFLIKSTKFLSPLSISLALEGPFKPKVF